MSVSGCALCGKRVGSGGRVELIRSTPVPDTRYWHDDCWRQHSNPGSDDGMSRGPGGVPGQGAVYRYRAVAYAFQVVADDKPAAVRWLLSVGYRWDDHLGGCRTGAREEKGFYYGRDDVGEPLTVRAPGGAACRVSAGDWLVLHPDGVVQVYADAAFRRLFEEAE